MLRAGGQREAALLGGVAVQPVVVDDDLLVDLQPRPVVTGEPEHVRAAGLHAEGGQRLDDEVVLEATEVGGGLPVDRLLELVDVGRLTRLQGAQLRDRLAELEDTHGEAGLVAGGDRGRAGRDCGEAGRHGGGQGRGGPAGPAARPGACGARSGVDGGQRHLDLLGPRRQDARRDGCDVAHPRTDPTVCEQLLTGNRHKGVVPVTVPLVLEDLGRLLHRWRRPVLATWAVVVVLGAVLGGSVFDLAEAPDPLRDDSESAQVKERLEAADPEGELVVAVLSGADIYGVDLIDQATRTLHDVRDLPDVVEVRDPWTTGAQDLVRPDRFGTVVTVEIDHTVDRDRALAAAAEVEKTLQQVGMPEVLVGGPLLAEEAFGEQAVQDAARGEGVAILVLVVVLALALGGLVVGLLPVATALGSVCVALLALSGLARLTPVSDYAVNVVTLLGLGLAVDYALLVLGRFREDPAGNGSDVLRCRQSPKSARYAERTGSPQTGRHSRLRRPARREDQLRTRQSAVLVSQLRCGDHRIKARRGQIPFSGPQYRLHVLAAAGPVLRHEAAASPRGCSLPFCGGNRRGLRRRTSIQQVSALAVPPSKRMTDLLSRDRGRIVPTSSF